MVSGRKNLQKYIENKIENLKLQMQEKDKLTIWREDDWRHTKEYEVVLEGCMKVQKSE